MKASLRLRFTRRGLTGGLTAIAAVALAAAGFAQSNYSGAATNNSTQNGQATSSGRASSASSNAATPTNAQLLAEVAVLDQINSLQLTGGQIRDIVSRLSRLEAAAKAFDTSSDQQAKPVRSQLLRIRAALDANKAPAPADETAVSKAINGLDTQRSGLAQLRQQTVEGIRVELSRSQLDAVRVDVGMEPAEATAEAAAGPQAGPQWAAAAYGAGGSNAMGPPPTPANSPYIAASLNANAAQTLAILEQVRTTPLLDYQRERADVAANLAAAAGDPPGSPYFAQALITAGGILDNVRAMNATDFQVASQQIAANIALQAYQTQLNAQQLVQNAVGAVADSDDAAVSQFFLNEDMLRALRGKAGH